MAWRAVVDTKRPCPASLSGVWLPRRMMEYRERTWCQKQTAGTLVGFGTSLNLPTGLERALTADVLTTDHATVSAPRPNIPLTSSSHRYEQFERQYPKCDKFHLRTPTRDVALDVASGASRSRRPRSADSYPLDGVSEAVGRPALYLCLRDGIGPE